MKYLLDTHTLFWFLLDNKKLGLRVRTLLANSERNEIVVSVVSFAEIEIKRSTGKLRVEDNIQQLVSRYELQMLPLQAEHTLALRGLPLVHRDPFDRLLIAQAMSERMTLITGDRDILKYPDVLLLDARR